MTVRWRTLTALLVVNPGRRYISLHPHQYHLNYWRAIYLEADLFNHGVRPAINPAFPFPRWRFGSDPAMKSWPDFSASVRTVQELAAFSQFGSDLNRYPGTSQSRRAVWNLKQPQYRPIGGGSGPDSLRFDNHLDGIDVGEF